MVALKMSASASVRPRAARPGASKPLIVTRASQPDAPPQSDLGSLERSLNSAQSIDIVPSEADGPVSLERSSDEPVSTSNSGEVGKSGAFSLEGSLKGMILLNLGALLFGSNQVVIKTTEELLSPIALDALRFGAAALCFAPLLPRALKQPQLIRPALELGVWLTGLLLCACSAGVHLRQYLCLAAMSTSLERHAPAALFVPDAAAAG